MASSLLALIDDIATLLDDVAILTRISAKQAAGAMGIDVVRFKHNAFNVNAIVVVFMQYRRADAIRQTFGVFQIKGLDRKSVV